MKYLIAITLGIALAFTATVVLASRNASGTYSLPAHHPFVSGTVISSANANTDWSDVATELTDSLSRSGKGGMTAALRCIDGTVGVPSYSWTNDTDTGFYLITTADVGLSIAGSKLLEQDANGLTESGWVDIAGTSTVGGAATFSGTVTMDDWATIAGTLTVSDAVSIGTTTVTGTFDATGAVSTSGEIYLHSPDPLSTTAYSNTITTKNTIKAWARLSAGVAGAVTVSDGFNITSASWATNQYTITFETDFGDTNYLAVVSYLHTSAVRVLVITGLSTGSMTVDQYDSSGAAASISPGEQITVIAIGAN